jgi:hypothetical protein
VQNAADAAVRAEGVGSENQKESGGDICSERRGGSDDTLSTRCAAKDGATDSTSTGIGARNRGHEWWQAVAAEASRQLAALAYLRGSVDNISAAVVFLKALPTHRLS